jgi:hypothetical protein
MPHYVTFKPVALIALAGAALACGPVDHEPSTPIEITRSSLSAVLGDDVQPTGMAIDEESGQRYFLDPALGILEALDTGEVVVRWSPPPELPELTDLCAVGGGRFVAAANGDGYVIDIAAGTARQHFCLEPGGDPGFDPGFDPGAPAALDHLNRAVACDIEAGLIYGQPQTVPQEGEPLPIRSEMASYRLSTGADVDWVLLPEATYHAGGMTVLESGRILLGAGSTISLYDASTQVLTQLADLSRSGVQRIEAITIDRAAGTIELVDGGAEELVSVPLAALGLAP